MRRALIFACLMIGLGMPSLALAELSRDEAARLAQQQTGGKVLSVDSRNGGYRVKVLKDNGEIVILQLGNEPTVGGRAPINEPPAMGLRDNGQKPRQQEDNRNGGNNNRRPFPFKDGF